MKKMKSKKAQQEMVGFALIVVIVSVLILIFFVFALKKNTDFEQSYEVEAFIQAFLQQTTNCSTDYYPNYEDIQGLIFECGKNSVCLGGISSCEILNLTIEKLLKDSLQVGEEFPMKAYSLEIFYLGDDLMFFEKGELTKNNKGAVQKFQDADISLTFYS